MTARLRIGTRGSALALAQTNEVRLRLTEAHPELGEPGAVEIVVIQTSGDRFQDRRLSEIGGKGLFTKEIEEALLDGRIDIAVHSMKDVPTALPPGLDVPCLLPREDPRDAFFARGTQGLDDLPAGAVIGTSSLRRQSQVLARRPDLRVVPLRGNVARRLARLEAGEVDGTLLAVAGLRRLGETDRIDVILSTDHMLPATAQGAIGVECREADRSVRDLLQPIHSDATWTAVAAERAMLAVLDGNCRTPIAGLALPAADGGLTLEGLVAEPDGSRVVRLSLSGPADDPVALGRSVGEALLAGVASGAG